jgi:hypothetical protein
MQFGGSQILNGLALAERRCLRAWKDVVGVRSPSLKLKLLRVQPRPSPEALGRATQFDDQ